MNKTALLVFPCLLASVGFAQTTKTVTSPVGFENKDGYYHAYYLGRYASQRQQNIDGGFKGSTKVLTQLDFRRDRGRQYTTTTGTGRTFSKVALSLGLGDHTKMTKTFSTNYTGSLSKVFEAKMTWPDWLRTSLSTPWGANKQLSFPFSSIFAYSGKSDLLFDFTLTGGVLKNNGAWSGGTSKSYYLDGPMSVTSTQTHKTRGYDIPYPFANGGTTCNDSATGTISGAYTRLKLDLYSDAYTTNTTLQGTFAAEIQSRYTAPAAPIIRVIAYGGNETGTNIGAYCNKLYIDMTKIVLMETIAKTAAGTSLTTTTYAGKYQNFYGGATLWAQSAWTESKLNRFALTTVFEMPLPPKPTRLPKVQVFATSATSATAKESPSFSQWKQLLPRLTVK